MSTPTSLPTCKEALTMKKCPTLAPKAEDKEAEEVVEAETGMTRRTTSDT